jgi:hypothetical protein
MSKGSNPRPVDRTKFNENFDKIFKQRGKKDDRRSKPGDSGRAKDRKRP